MSNNNIFEMALDESLIKKASKEIYQIYTELKNAGFDSDSAIKIMIGMLSVPQKRNEDE